MRIRNPRWLLILEGMLLLGALLFLVYKAAMVVRPLPPVAIKMTPHETKQSPQNYIRGYYEKYPERYIQIRDESWRYLPVSHTAIHDLTLYNAAKIAYDGIEIRFTYESAEGRTLHTKDIRVPGLLAASGSIRLKEIKVDQVPQATASAVASIIKAQVVK